MIERLFRQGNTMRIVDGIPLDAIVQHVSYDLQRDAFLVAVVHPDWPPVELGTLLPVHTIAIEAVYE